MSSPPTEQRLLVVALQQVQAEQHLPERIGLRRHDGAGEIVAGEMNSQAHPSTPRSCSDRRFNGKQRNRPTALRSGLRTLM
jgi:hypothetical protein